MDIYHMHHIVPKHMGGTDDKENLKRVTLQEHAKEHKILYEKYGKLEDKLAWLGLSGMITNQEIISSLQAEVGRKTGKSNKGKKHPNCKKVIRSEEFKKKISDTRKKSGLGKESAKYLPKKIGELNHMKSPEHRKRMSELASKRYRIYREDGSWFWGYKDG